jgi:hypothetical protein
MTEVFLDDTAVGGAIILEELKPARLTAARDTSAGNEQLFAWSEVPLQQGNLPACAGQGPYKADFAADSLAEACIDPEQCSLDFQSVETDAGVAEFSLLAPELKASVGLRYGLTVSDTAGRSSTREFDFCLSAINDPPVAGDDTFLVREGVLEYFGPDGLNLMTNDRDDIDISNDGLTILTTPIIAPASAAEFELFSDGSFTYESSLSGILTDQFDTFRYAITDGPNTVEATVTIRIAASNQAPELVDDIPLLAATAEALFEIDLAAYFVDPENGALTFAFASDAVLPGEGTLALDQDGVLSGIADEADVGTYVMTLVVSDGGRSIETVVNLTVEPAPLVPANSPPEYVDGVGDRTLRLGRTMLPIIPEFIDPDGDLLTYTIIGRGILPDGLEIDEETGVVSGIPEEAVWVRELRIEATDPFGQSAVSDSFFIRVL